eukprot:Gregarina_sp_Pseudo_9__3786@NODE_3937_length_524_cov_72_614433_g3611_i0_p1_GENE_NODE_3937_length_524_cov_72_614433_g3611_i0NODE_3937_length_524_cov_72_614433_g3611_i0_p1_ORF_typecomplete_len152_score18_71_NODE_3937_length_524_cov_72_614433_g3611_i055510
MVAECLRKYMQLKETGLSLEAQSLLSQMDADRSLVDKWMEFDFKEGRTTYYNYHTPMYAEMKVRVKRFEAESGTEVCVSDTLFIHTEKWLKERYLEWQYSGDEIYPEGCGGGVLLKLFDKRVVVHGFTTDYLREREVAFWFCHCLGIRWIL